jgi:hypothetical protein
MVWGEFDRYITYWDFFLELFTPKGSGYQLIELLFKNISRIKVCS